MLIEFIEKKMSLDIEKPFEEPPNCLDDIEDMKHSEQTITRNLILIGESRAGKTSLLERVITGDFKQNYQPTHGTSDRTKEVLFLTNKYPICLRVYDQPGGLIAKDEIKEADCKLYIYDVSSDSSVKKIDKLYDIKNNVPSVVCGNKCDLEKNKKPNKISDEYIYFISVKDNYNIYKPFEDLIQKLLNDKIQIIKSL